MALVNVDFESCCGQRLYFAIDDSLVPTYLLAFNTYRYFGPVVTDYLGGVMYPNQCYFTSQISGVVVGPTRTAPPPVTDFGPSLAPGPDPNCTIIHCDHCFFKLTNCFDPNDVIVTYSNIGAYLNRTVKIEGHTGCYLVTETSIPIPTPVSSTVVSDYSDCPTCSGIYSNIKLTPCCETDVLPVIVDGTNLGLIDSGAEVWCITSITPYVSCWTASYTLDPVNYYEAITVGTKSSTCGKCLDDGCPDCATKAYKITACDETLGLVPIITNNDLSLNAGKFYKLCITGLDREVTWPVGCYCVSVEETTVQNGIIFTEVFGQEYNCCKDCTQVCYLLEDCQGAVDPIITCSDLSGYVNNVVKLSYCGNICWKVTKAENCTGSILVGDVIAHYPAGYIEKNSCLYDIPTIRNITSFNITINGTAHTFTYVSSAQLLDDINSLGLGLASNVGPTLNGAAIVIAGENTYGNLCFNHAGLPQICVTPTCFTYHNHCEYSDIPSPLSNLAVSITIDGVLHSTTLTGLGIGKLLTWLNSLDLGIFGANCDSGACKIEAYGNHEYGNITIGLSSEQDTYIPTCESFVDFASACMACLPPAPEPAPLVLHPRRIKPGYFSKNSCITTEYMERVNCTFAKQVYDAMLIKRYGITVCCDHDVDKWDVKKQILDFELLTDPGMCKSTLCYCPDPCLVRTYITVLPTCVAPYFVSSQLTINCADPNFVSATVVVQETPKPCYCYMLIGTNYTVGWIDCCCVYQSATYAENSTVCAQYPPVILSGSVAVIEGGNCGSESCVIPVPSCVCYSVSPGKSSGGVSYISCSGIPVIGATQYVDFNVCAQSFPVSITPGYTPAITSLGLCSDFGDCGITNSCVCYVINVTSNDTNPATAVIQTQSCGDIHTPVTTTVTSTTNVFLCSWKYPVVLSGSANVNFVGILIKDQLDCGAGQCVAP